MNKPRIVQSLCVLALILALQGAPGMAQEIAPQAAPLGTAFTYQGRLQKDGAPVNGNCDLVFKLWDAPTGGSQVGATQTKSNVSVSQGIFTARLDFGPVHNGSARWLEIAVRCPAGTGSYITLTPRQELTAAPAALSLALPFTAEANIGGPLVMFENDGDGEALLLSSRGSGLWIEDIGADGIRVADAGGNGLAVGTAGADGVVVTQAGNPPAVSPNPLNNGFEVAGAEANGLAVGSAGMHGVYVWSAAYDGFKVYSTGTPSAAIASDARNGFEVAGAEGNGLWVGRADQAGVVVASAGSVGVYVGPAVSDGVHVNWAGGDGVRVHMVGSVAASVPSDAHNGFEVGGAQGYGLYVGRADLDGVYVNATGWHGVNIASANVDGLYVSAAGSDGVDVAGGAYAGNFRGNINVTGDCVGCTLVVFGRNASAEPLEPGQIVAIQGMEAAALDNAAHLWRVVPAAAGQTAIGVVRGRAELEQTAVGAPLYSAPLYSAPLYSAPLREGESGARLIPASGFAAPGDFLSIVIYGPIQVKGSDTTITPGTRLVVASDGSARPLKTLVVEGVTLAESAPTIGIALAAPDPDGLVWVLVNPQ